MAGTATEATFQKDSKLSEDDKKAIQAALEEGKVGRLLSKKQVFG